jgi:hypothetical protein
MHSREVLQVGIVDSKGAAVLDCLTRYNEGVTAPSESTMPTCSTSLECILVSRSILTIWEAPHFLSVMALAVRTVCGCYRSDVALWMSSSSGPATWRQGQWERKVRQYSTVNGTLDAKGVVAKLQAKGIDKETIFVAWATWRFDLRIYITTKINLSHTQPQTVEATKERKDGDEERPDMNLWKGGCINSLRE